ncbi:Ndc80p [Sugiyamaella lignohabitans]|uniref:Kinetochore protein NDC80 n=1 Tax=Sugiyamaella lignohabitans TaxID=796027 RepID=A0A167FTK1_9ASCO|nr:Ndc80p [Sugiyamaella lignohabitans]ANB15685.1 Ndc80p [Sugiyamaella lignohabitans]
MQQDFVQPSYSQGSYSTRRKSRIAYQQQPLASLDNHSLNIMATPASNNRLRKPSFRPSLAPGGITTSQQLFSGASSIAPPSALRGVGGAPPSAASRARQSIVPSRGLSGVFNNRNTLASSGQLDFTGGVPVSGAGGSNNGPGSGAAPGSVRKSMIPSAPPSSVRRQPPQSAVSRQSSFGIAGGGNSAFYSSGAPVLPPSSSLPPASRDPRPTRDRGYMATISQEIYEYLTQNGFAVEMKHPLTPKTLKAPTQKDFVMLFQWLYRRLDPGYRFTKAIDTEVYYLLRTIQYPYLESINKSQIAAVGGQNWPTFMAMLHWMVQLNITMENYDWETENAQSSDEGVLSQILDRYAAKSYRSKLDNEMDFSEYRVEVEQEITQFSESVQASIQEAEEEIELIRKRYQDLRKEADNFESLEKKGQALESDLVKFKDYIDAMETRKAKWTAIIDRLTLELENAGKELRVIQEEKASLQDQIAAQGLTPNDIDRMNAEREKLIKSLEQLESRQEEMTKQMNESELLTQNAFDEMETQLQKYHKDLYKVGIDDSGFQIPSTLFDTAFADENLGKRVDQVLQGIDLRNSIRPMLQRYRQEISERIHQSHDESIRLQEQLDRTSEGLNEKRDQVETLEAKLNANNITYNEIYETMNSEATTSNAKIEQLERDIHSMKSATQQELLQVEQKCHDIAIEHDKVKNAVLTSRAKMNNDLNQLITYIVSFKLYVQSGLEDYESMVTEEWNAQIQLENNLKSTAHGVLSPLDADSAL